MARDAFGLRDLFWAEAGPFLFVSNEVSGLLRLSSVDARPDEETILEFLTYDYRSHARSFFKSVRQVPPGHWAEVTKRGWSTTRYFLPSREAPLRSELELLAEGRHLFNAAVRTRLAQAGPSLGSHLSGGLDSGAIVLVADRILDREGGPSLTAGSARYPGLSCDEGPGIDEVLRATGVDHRSWKGVQALWSDESAAIVDGPGALYPWVGGSDGDLTMARDVGASVILSGAGGDEAGAWTGVFLDLAERGAWLRLALEIGLFSHDPARQARLFQMVAHKVVSEGRRPMSAPPRAAPWMSESLRALSHERARQAADENNQRELAFASQLEHQVWERCTRPTRAFFLSYERVAARRRGVRYRYPFLDTSFVQWCLAAARAPLLGFHLPQGHPKPLHRKLFQDLYPRRHRDLRRDTGFAPAIEAEVRLARPFLDRLFNDSRWESAPFVDQKEVRTFAASLWRVGAGERRAGHDPSLMMGWWQVRETAKLELWLRSVLQFRATMQGDSRRGDQPVEVSAESAVEGASYVPPALDYVGNLRDILAATGSPIDADGLGFRD